MKLNKSHPNELYQWWVVASLALQAHAAAVQARLAPAPADSTGSTGSSSSQPAGLAAAAAAAGAGLGADKLLALAEAMAGRLLAKPPAQGGQHSWESVMMYLGLLQAQVSSSSMVSTGTLLAGPAVRVVQPVPVLPCQQQSCSVPCIGPTRLVLRASTLAPQLSFACPAYWQGFLSRPAGAL